MAPSDLIELPPSTYRGLRMTADEFLALPEDPARYELIDGVVQMSPSASFWHQRLVTEILLQFGGYLDLNPIGEVVTDVDVKLRGNLVYRPDIIYLAIEKARRCRDKITEIPDLVIEIVSPDSRSLDSKTKRKDYEAAGVREYWIIDPMKGTFLFLVLRDGRYVEAPFESNRYQSAVLPGFELDLERLRRLF